MAFASTHKIEAVMRDVQNRDKLGLHDLRILEKKLKDLLAQFDAAPPVVGSEDERERRDHIRTMCLQALIDLTRNEATQYLITGNYDKAVRTCSSPSTPLLVTIMCLLLFLVRRPPWLWSH